MPSPSSSMSMCRTGSPCSFSTVNLKVMVFAFASKALLIASRISSSGFEKSLATLCGCAGNTAICLATNKAGDPAESVCETLALCKRLWVTGGHLPAPLRAGTERAPTREDQNMDLERMEGRLTRLEDIEAIKQLKARYCEI